MWNSSGIMDQSTSLTDFKRPDHSAPEQMQYEHVVVFVSTGVFKRGALEGDF
jgi:hypothetical protein